MKLDLAKFKKTKEDERSTELLHPEGHTIRIAHAKLSPAFKKQLKALPLHKAEGGEVESDDSGDASAAPAQPPVVVNVNSAPAASPSPEPMPDRTPASGSPALDTFKDYFMNWTSRRPPSEAQTEFLRGLEEKQAAEKAPAAPPPAASSSAAPAAQRAPAAPSPLASGVDAATKLAQNGIGTQIQGEKEKANALGEIGKEEAGLYGSAAEKAQALAGEFQKHYQDLETERQSFMKDLENGHVDPEHYWTNHSKVASAIGLILGGLGGGLTGGGNPAVQFLQKQMDMDLQAQQANLGKKKTLLEANMRQFGNLHDAMLATRVMQSDMLAAKIHEIASKNANPVAQANAKIAIGPLMQQSAQLQQQLALRRALISMQSSRGEDHVGDALPMLRMLSPESAKEMESRYVPGLGVGSIPLDQKSRDELTTRSELETKLSKLQDFAEKHSGNLSPAVQNQGKVLAQDAQDAYRRANGQGVFREAEAGFVNSMIDEDPTKFFANFRTLPKYKAVREGNRSALEAKAKSFGLPTPKFAASDDTKTMGGVAYRKVPGGWIPVKGQK